MNVDLSLFIIFVLPVSLPARSCDGEVPDGRLSKERINQVFR
jgi:hypothetical protein